MDLVAGFGEEFGGFGDGGFDFGVGQFFALELFDGGVEDVLHGAEGLLVAADEVGEVGEYLFEVFEGDGFGLFGVVGVVSDGIHVTHGVLWASCAIR